MSVLTRLGSLRSTLVLLALVLLVMLAIVGDTWWAIEQDRQLTLAAERAHGLLAVRLLEEHAGQSLAAGARRVDAIAIATEATDLALGPTMDAIKKNIVEHVRNSRAPAAFQYASLDGVGWASETDYPPYVFSAEPRPYINFLNSHPAHRDLVVGRPLLRSIDSELVLPLARNLFNRSRRHVGIISTELSLSQFSAIYARVASDSHATVQLIADAGYVILRAPGSTPREDPVLPIQLRDGQIEGSFEAAAVLGETANRLYTFRKSQEFPVTVVMGRELDAVLAPWKQRSLSRFQFAAVFAGLIALLVVYLLLQLRRLMRSQASLRASDDALRVSEAKFVRLFQRSPVPLALISLEHGQWIETNDAFITQFGYPREQLHQPEARNMPIWQSDAQRTDYLRLLHEQQEIDTVELPLHHHSGRALTCLASSRLILNEGETVAIFSPIDVTWQRAVEHEIRELNVVLEQRVRERTLTLEHQHGQLQVAIEHAEQAGRAKARVLAAASHDLRQPLHALSLYSGVLSGNPDPATLSVVAKHIDLSVRALNALLNALLDLSKLDAGVFQIERCVFSLTDLLARVCNDYRAHAEYKGITLQLEVPALLVYSDPIIVERVARNLIDNAVKYTDTGTVAVSAHALAGMVTVAVRDTGRGIAPEQQQQVFEEFYQIDNPGRDRSEGLGLGLSIVLRLTTLIEADLIVDSAPGVGSCFSWRLPHCQERVQARHASPAPPAPAMTACTLAILLVDDELAILHSMSLLLASWGYLPLCAGDPQQAHAIMAQRVGRVDLMIVDLRLGHGGDGLLLAATLRARWGAIPVLLVSGETNPSKLKDAAASGFPILHKPLSPDTLHESILNTQR